MYIFFFIVMTWLEKQSSLSVTVLIIFFFNYIKLNLCLFVFFYLLEQASQLTETLHWGHTGSSTNINKIESFLLCPPEGSTKTGLFWVPVTVKLKWSLCPPPPQDGMTSSLSTYPCLALGTGPWPWLSPDPRSLRGRGWVADWRLKQVTASLKTPVGEHLTMLEEQDKQDKKEEEITLKPSRRHIFLVRSYFRTEVLDLSHKNPTPVHGGIDGPQTNGHKVNVKEGEGEDETETLLVQWTLKGFGNSDPPSWVVLLGESADCTPVWPSFSDSFLFRGESVVTLAETPQLLGESAPSSVQLDKAH